MNTSAWQQKLDTRARLYARLRELYHPALRPTLSGSRAIPQGSEVRFSDGDAATPPIRRAGGSDERSC
jgi:hypothetical protein